MVFIPFVPTKTNRELAVQILPNLMWAARRKKKAKTMIKRHPIKKKKLSKGRLAYMKAMRSPDDMTWDDVQAYQNEAYQPQPPSPPLRERLQTVDMGMRPEQAERVVKDTKTKWQKFAGVFNKSKNLATKGGKTALTTGKRVISLGTDYTKRLDQQSAQTLAQIDKDYWAKDQEPEEDETQYVEYNEPDVDEDIEEPSVDEGAGEPNIEEYTRRKHRKPKIKRVKHHVKKKRIKRKKIIRKKLVKRRVMRHKKRRVKKRRKR